MTSGTKTFDNRVSLVRYQLTEYNGSPPGTFNPSGSSLVGFYRTKTWSGDDTPTPGPRPKGKKRVITTVDSKGRPYRFSFRERLPKRVGFRSPTNYDMSAETKESVAGIYEVGTRLTFGNTWSRNVYSNCSSEGAGFGMSFHPSPTWTANDDIKLINRLKEEMYGSEFNAAVFLGEANQTLNLIGDSAIKIAKAFMAFKHGRPGDAASILVGTRNLKRPRTHKAKAGSNWLELQYGWLPLLSDIREGAQQVAYHLSSPMRRRYRATASQKIVGPRGPGTYWEYAECSSVYRKQIIAYASEPPTVAQYSGILDPELVLWELTPFSFVADWVAPFGDYLSARAFAGRLTGLFVTTTKLTQKCGGLRGRPYQSGSTVYSFGCQGSDSRTVTTMSRRISNNLSVPLPVVKPLSKAASWEHCANAIALLTQVVKKS